MSDLGLHCLPLPYKMGARLISLLVYIVSFGDTRCLVRGIMKELLLLYDIMLINLKKTPFPCFVFTQSFSKVWSTIIRHFMMAPTKPNMRGLKRGAWIDGRLVSDR